LRQHFLQFDIIFVFRSLTRIRCVKKAAKRVWESVYIWWKSDLNEKWFITVNIQAYCSAAEKSTNLFCVLMNLWHFRESTLTHSLIRLEIMFSCYSRFKHTRSNIFLSFSHTQMCVWDETEWKILCCRIINFEEEKSHKQILMWSKQHLHNVPCDCVMFTFFVSHSLSSLCAWNTSCSHVIKGISCNTVRYMMTTNFLESNFTWRTQFEGAGDGENGNLQANKFNIAMLGRCKYFLIYLKGRFTFDGT
jgi:hypothetical protein